jgi:hypothetical protein
VQARQFSFTALILGAIPGFYSVVLIALNNLRDRESDILSNKRTLAVRFGMTFTRVEIFVCLLACCLIPLWLAADGLLPWLGASAALMPSMQAARTVGREVFRIHDMREINRLFPTTWRCQFGGGCDSFPLSVAEMTSRLHQVGMQHDFFRYALPLPHGRPREGILLRLEDSNGAVGWGDAAPLPGWSCERLEDVIKCIQAGPPWQNVPSSLAFALEAASASLANPQKNATHGVELPLNALLDGDFNEILHHSWLVLERGMPMPQNQNLPRANAGASRAAESDLQRGATRVPISYRSESFLGFR